MTQLTTPELIEELRDAYKHENWGVIPDLADRIEAHGIEPPDSLEAEIHKVAKKYITKRNQGRFMGDIRAMLAATPKQEVKP